MLFLLSFIFIALQSNSPAISAASNSSSSCSPRERDALLDFMRYAVEHHPAGYWFSTWAHPPNSTVSDSEPYDCCQWKGVSCDTQGMVTKIDLNDCWQDNADEIRMSARMNTEGLGALSAIAGLSHLDFSCQHFHGSIAAEIGNLTSLTQLFLYDNNLTGPLPASMQHLKSLVYLHVGNNQLSQEIPSFLLQLPSLENLYMLNNNFSGAIPDAFTNQTKIRSLVLSNNQLEGFFPLSMQHVMSLEHLDLSNNPFRPQEIPSSLLQLPSLNTLYLDSNNLKGSIPDAFTNLTEIKNLFLSHNQLDGPLPPSMKHLKSLQDADLSHNHFTGVIPDMFTDFTQLTTLDLSHNHLSGLLPTSMQYLKSLQNLDLSNNQFSPQEIPSSILLLPSLNILDLSFNNFTGIDHSFPLDSYSLQNAASFNDSQNQLQYLNLASNKLSRIDSIFHEESTFQHLKNLIVLDLRDNQLQGPFPASSSDIIQDLLILNLNNNRLQGPLPSFLRSLRKLTLLDLGSNELNGSIPEWIGPGLSRDLRFLLLAGNRLTGTIPASVGQLEAMQNFNSSLTKTEFQRAIGLDVYVYSFPVDIRISMKGQTLTFNDVPSLSAIDLSGNQLTGAIPPGLGNLKGLVSLNLSGNNLVDEIPGTLGALTNLESLDLSRNMLQGHIPDSFDNLEQLGFVNMSSNRLSGSIPSSLHWLDTFDESCFEDNDGLCTVDAVSLAKLPVCGVAWSPIVQPKDEEGIVGWGGFAVGYLVGFLLGLFVVVVVEVVTSSLIKRASFHGVLLNS